VRVITGSDENLGLVGLGKVSAELIIVDVIYNLGTEKQLVG
jgi:hypothetical protein